MMPCTDNFSIRMDQSVYDQMMLVIQCTGNEVTRSGLINRAVHAYLRLLEIEPSMIPEYDPEAHLSVTQRASMSRNEDRCNTINP